MCLKIAQKVKHYIGNFSKKTLSNNFQKLPNLVTLVMGDMPV